MVVPLLQIIILFVVPIVLHNLLNDKSISRWISPVVACFIIGISVGTFLVAKLTPELSDKVMSLSKNVESISIIIAIPLLLMTSNFMEWLPKGKIVMKSFCIASFSVLIGVVATFIIYRGFTDDGWMISSMLLAGFVGTNANLNAVGIALNCPDDLALLINFGDMFTGAFYLIILTSIAHPLLSKILPKYKYYSKGLLFDDAKTAIDPKQDEENDFSYIYGYKMNRFGIYVLPIILSILTFGVSVVLEMLFLPSKGMDPTFLILSVTVIGILMSMNKQLRSLKSSFRIGEYLLLVFCIALGTHIDIMQVFKGSTLVLSYTTVVMLFVVPINIILAYLFKVDADTTIITSTATIFGPAFIGQVAMSMKNKEIIFSGMIASMVGIAIANFGGIMLSRILHLF